jgi:hypothetical protein
VQLKKKRSTDSRLQSVVRQKSRQGGKQRRGGLRKSGGRQRLYRRPEHEVEAEGPEAGELQHQLLPLEIMWVLADKLDVVSVAAGQAVVEPAAELGEGCVGEAGA